MILKRNSEGSPLAEILRFSRRHALWGLAGTLVGCSGGLPASGPSNAQIEAASKPTSSRAVQFALLDVSPAVVAKMETWPKPTLQGSFGRQPAVRSQTIGVGDSVQVVIWEAVFVSGSRQTQPRFEIRLNSRAGRGQ